MTSPKRPRDPNQKAKLIVDVATELEEDNSYNFKEARGTDKTSNK